jgi:hypothetical protein
MKYAFIRLQAFDEKRGAWVEFGTFGWSCFKLFTLIFSEESVQTPSCESLKLLSEQLLFSNNRIAPDDYKKIWELACPVVNSNNTVKKQSKYR